MSQNANAPTEILPIIFNRNTKHIAITPLSLQPKNTPAESSPALADFQADFQ